jgi:hypothetical protein
MMADQLMVAKDGGHIKMEKELVVMNTLRGEEVACVEV